MLKRGFIWIIAVFLLISGVFAYDLSEFPNIFIGHKAVIVIGSAAKADRIEIHWPSGHVSNMTNIKADQTLVIKED